MGNGTLPLVIVTWPFICFGDLIGNSQKLKLKLILFLYFDQAKEVKKGHELTLPVAFGHAGQSKITLRTFSIQTVSFPLRCTKY